MPARRHWRSAVLAAAVAAAIFGLYSTAAGGGAPAERAYQFVKSVYPREL